MCEGAKWSLTASGALGTESGNLMSINESTENSRSQKELTGKVWETMALIVERTRECYQRRSRALSDNA